MTPEEKIDTLIRGYLSLKHGIHDFEIIDIKGNFVKIKMVSNKVDFSETDMNISYIDFNSRQIIAEMDINKVDLFVDRCLQKMIKD